MALSKTSLARAIAVAVVVAGVGLALYYGEAIKTTKAGKQYQAVFLTNGQVYFGKVKSVTNDTTVLTDIFYLQVQQPIQPVSEEEKNKQQNQIQLVKLGNELHKPKDEMTIRNDQILFTEEIQNDGQVGQAIDRFKKGDTGQPAPSTETQAQPKQ